MSSAGAPSSFIEAVSITGDQTITGNKTFTGTLTMSGGTVTSQATGDLIVASSATALGRVADVATGQVLKSGGVGAPPAYGAIGGTTGATSPAFTGTASTAAETAAFTGTGFATAGQVVQTSDNQTMTLNQCANMWLITATQAPCLIVSNAAVAGAPAVLTVFGLAPTTAAEAYKILKAPTPAGSVASHTHSGTGLT
jgi:hypothetical protein